MFDRYKKPSTVVKHAIALIETPGGWTKGWLMRRRKNGVACYCVSGAIAKVQGVPEDHLLDMDTTLSSDDLMALDGIYEEVLEAIMEVKGLKIADWDDEDLVGKESAVVNWNDKSSKQGVLGALRKAEVLLREKGR